MKDAIIGIAYGTGVVYLVVSISGIAGFQPIGKMG